VFGTSSLRGDAILDDREAASVLNSLRSRTGSHDQRLHVTDRTLDECAFAVTLVKLPHPVPVSITDSPSDKSSLRQIRFSLSVEASSSVVVGELKYADEYVIAPVFLMQECI
jgi:hypothetical protein